METLTIYLPTKLTTLVDWLNARLNSVRPEKHPPAAKDDFLADLVFFSTEEEMTQYLNSFRGEE